MLISMWTMTWARLGPVASTVGEDTAVGRNVSGGLALILGIDRFMSEARAITNVIGNGVAAIVVAKWTGDLDTDMLASRLASGPAKAARSAEASTRR